MCARNLIIVLSTLFTLTGCGQVEELERVSDNEPAGVMSSSLVEGSPAAVGMLNFLNDESTDFVVLDIDAKLDRRSASGLIHHRNGPDGVFGTWDDDQFDTVAEVDAIKWIGPRTLARLENFAAENGWVPAGDDTLAIVEGIPFNVWEAEVALQLANFSTFAELDGYLNRRAAANLVAQRPFRTLDGIASVRYVGPTALKALRAAAQAEINGVFQNEGISNLR